MIFKASFVYVLFTLIEKGGWFLFLPLLSHYLEPSDFGNFALFTLIHTLISIVSSFSLNHAFGKIYYEEKINCKVFENTIVSFFIFFSLLLIFFNFVFYDFFYDNLERLIDYDYILPLLLVCAFQPTVDIYKTVLQVKMQPFKYSFISLLLFVIKMVTAFLLIFYYNFNGLSLAFGVLISYFLIYVLVLISYISEITNFNFSILKYSLFFSIKLMIHNISNAFISSADRLMIKHYSGVYNLGIYTLSFQFSSVISILADSINQSWTPLMFKKIQSDSGRKELACFGNIINFSLIIISLFTILLSEVVVEMFFDVSYYNISDYIPLLVLVTLLNSYTYLFGSSILVEKPNSLSRITLFSAIFNIILNFILIPIYDIYGAILGTIIQKIFTLLLLFVTSRATNKYIPYSISGMFFGFLFAVLTTLCISYNLLNFEFLIYLTVFFLVLLVQIYIHDLKVIFNIKQLKGRLF